MGGNIKSPAEGGHQLLLRRMQHLFVFKKIWVDRSVR